MKKASNWWQFTKERFHPASHIMMIAVFIATHVLIMKKNYNALFAASDLVLLLIAVTAFYFKLRLYDEIKDYELDCEINPHRPLPRGLLTRRDMYNGMGVCILIESVIFALKGINPFISMIIAILYSLIMYKEFFIREKIRPHLTTYALVHTIVTSFLSIAIFSFISGLSFKEVIREERLLYFALANWFLFNLFEFGRKSFAESEERPGVDSYSSLFGKGGAMLLSLVQVLFAHFLIMKTGGLNNTFILFSHGALLAFFIMISLNYYLSSRVYAAKLFRNISSVYIILFYITLIIAMIF